MKKFVLFALNCTYFPTVSFTSETPSETASNVAAAASFILLLIWFVICDDVLWRIRFVGSGYFSLVGVFPFFRFFFSRSTQVAFLAERREVKKSRKSGTRIGKILLNYLYNSEREREFATTYVNDVNDKNDGRQTKCVYLLFRFFFFLSLLLFLFQTHENKRTSY